MAYDLVIGKSQYIKDSPSIFGSIDYDEHPSVLRILKHHPNWFFERLSNIYENERFGADELIQAAKIIDDLILKIETKPERRVLFKLSAAVSMAIRMGYPLFGVAD